MPALQLGRMLRGREGMLYFVFNRDVIAVVVAHNIDEGEFVAQVHKLPVWFLRSWAALLCVGLLGRLLG